MHKLFLCLRYLRKRRIAFFGMAAVALCVALLIVVTSLFDGFIRAYLEHTRRMLGDVVLVPPSLPKETQQLAQYLEEIDEIERALPVVRTGGLLYLGHGDVRAVEVLGVDLARCSREKMIRQGLLLQTKNHEPSFELPGPAQVAAKDWAQRKKRPTDAKLPIGAVVGIGILAEPDELTDQYDCPGIIAEHIRQRREPMIFTTGKASDATGGTGPIKHNRLIWPVDVLQTGVHDFDTRVVYLPFDCVWQLVAAQNTDGSEYCPGSVQITTAAEVEPRDAVRQVRRRWRSFAENVLGQSIDEINPAIVYAAGDDPQLRLFTNEIRKQLMILQIMLGLICLVAALLILVVLFMIVTQKRQDIAILRSLGASRRQVALLFVGYGGGIGTIGAALGLLLGVAATRNINFVEATLTKLLGFKIWKSGVYMFSKIPDEVAWGAVGWIVAAGIAAALLGAVLPAVKAARMQPVTALRYE